MNKEYHIAQQVTNNEYKLLNSELQMETFE